jgi:ATP-dependent protease Clp ATPase subunit
MATPRICKDCGTQDVIRKVLPKNYDIISNIAIELCSTCLHSRAQLQQMKEDKLPFPKLLAKIQNETAKRVSREIASVSSAERLRHGAYKGIAGWNTACTHLSQYWVEQLTQLE